MTEDGRQKTDDGGQKNEEDTGWNLAGGFSCEGDRDSMTISAGKVLSALAEDCRNPLAVRSSFLKPDT